MTLLAAWLPRAHSPSRHVWISLCWLIPAVLGGLMSPAFATTLVHRSLEELVARADVVLLGNVARCDSFWQGTQIYSLCSVDVHEIWAGKLRAPKKAVRVVTYGGMVGDIGQVVDGMGRLQTGETVVLHLKSRNDDYLLVGQAQGVWHVGRPTEGNGGASLKLATPAQGFDQGNIRRDPTHTVRMQDQGTGSAAALQAPPDAARERPLPTTVGELRAYVRAIAQGLPPSVPHAPPQGVSP